MNRNPYSPPVAEVADPVLPQAPASVRLAMQLIIAALALGAATLLVPGLRVPTQEEAEVPFAFTLVALVVFGGITLWLASCVMQGRNWARWSMLAYLVLGWVVFGMDFGDDFVRSPLSSMMDAACIALEAAACCLLFATASQQWFAAVALARRGLRR